MTHEDMGGKYETTTDHLA